MSVKLLLLLLVSSSCLFSQTFENKEYYDNGNLKAIQNYENGKLNGIQKNYHENGNLAIVGFMIDNNLDGEAKGYYENGNLEKVINWKNEKMNGEYTSYFKNGKLQSEGNYINDEMNGYWKGYGEGSDGKHYLVSEGKFIGQMIREGEHYTYHPNGFKAITEIYRNGELVKTIINKTYQIYFRNQTNEKTYIALRIYNSNKKWENFGWYILKPGEEKYLQSTKSRNIYYYAKDMDSFDDWEGDHYVKFKGQRLGFVHYKFEKGNYGKNGISLERD